MNLPFFYIPELNRGQQHLTLAEDSSRHIVQVLRMQVGDKIKLTDGQGYLLEATITENHKKACRVHIDKLSHQPASANRVVIGISLVKNASRFEWFLEKATELGIAAIVPLRCERTEKERFKTDRFRGILISAMLQSQQTWLPELREPASLQELLEEPALLNNLQKFIAHCANGEKKELVDCLRESAVSRVILIGPEGDFTSSELSLAFSKGFLPVSLGDTRLRTETAGVVAATLLCLV